LAPGLGLALQSAVVWVGAHTSLVGTNAYAGWSEAVPVLLLVAAVIRSGRARLAHWLAAGWSARWITIGAMVAGGALLWPMAQRGAWTLTSSSLGSCDHADYAAGARVFQEFSKDDRTGFMGHVEVTKVGTAETFFDYWLRLNHFTPSALIAHNGSILELQSYQLVSVTGVVLLLLNSALVMMLARVAAGLRGVFGLVPALIYLFSPFGAYAVHQGALGQLYAAHGIALLTLAIFAASQDERRGRSAWGWAPVVLAAIWLLAGSYNFILTIAGAPAAAWLLAVLVWRRDWRGPVRVALMWAAMAVACAILFWGRFDGLFERFQLFEQYDFGWFVPVSSPEGWLGVLRDTALFPWSRGVRVGLSAFIVGLAVVGVFRLWPRRRGSALASAALVLPVLVGWSMLAWEARTRVNASYDAFKLLSVFYPGLLVGLTALVASHWRTRGGRAVVGALLVIVAAANLWTTVLFARRMSTPALRVDRSLTDLHRLENMPRMTSINMRIENFWLRLWANAFLLRRVQYFGIHTYEARLNTEFKGEWDLSDKLLRSFPARESDYVDLNPLFHVVRVGAPGRLDLSFGDGWHPLEGAGFNRWRWSQGTASIVIVNPSSRPVAVRLLMRVRALERARLTVELGDAHLGSRGLNGNLQRMEFENLILPPGRSWLTLQTDRPAGRGEAGDPRLLAVALYEFLLTAEP
jgi:hypothetical protein